MMSRARSDMGRLYPVGGSVGSGGLQAGMRALQQKGGCAGVNKGRSVEWLRGGVRGLTSGDCVGVLTRGSNRYPTILTGGVQRRGPGGGRQNVVEHKERRREFGGQ